MRAAILPALGTQASAGIKYGVPGITLEVSWFGPLGDCVCLPRVSFWALDKNLYMEQKNQELTP